MKAELRCNAIKATAMVMIVLADIFEKLAIENPKVDHIVDRRNLDYFGLPSICSGNIERQADEATLVKIPNQRESSKSSKANKTMEDQIMQRHQNNIDKTKENSKIIEILDELCET